MLIASLFEIEQDFPDEFYLIEFETHCFRHFVLHHIPPEEGSHTPTPRPFKRWVFSER